MIGSLFLTIHRALSRRSTAGMRNTYCAVAAFQHPDPDLAQDPLSTNLRMLDVVDKAMIGTLVVAGQTADHIIVLIPDTVGLTVDADGPVDLQYVVGTQPWSRDESQLVTSSRRSGDLVMRALSGADSRNGAGGPIGKR